MKSVKKEHWFKAKRYGWGWYPATWQGWAVTVIFVIFILSNFKAINAVSHSESETLLAFTPNAFIATTILICICYLMGEKPEWRWGGKSLRKKKK